MGEWDEESATPLEDLRRAVAEVKAAPFPGPPFYYAGRAEYDWLISHGMNPDHVKLMEPLHIGLDLANGPDKTAIGWYDEMGRYQHLREFVDVKTPVIGERRLPSPAAAQKAKAKRRAQKRARKHR